MLFLSVTTSLEIISVLCHNSVAATAHKIATFGRDW